MSVGRAFLQAGARRVVASLWLVNDLATADLMEWFYGFLMTDHLSPGAALRKAQMKAIGTRIVSVLLGRTHATGELAIAGSRGNHKR